MSLLGPMGPPAPQMGPPSGLFGGMGPSAPHTGFGMPQGFGGYFGNIDKMLQSPSKVMGLGLLNSLVPGAGLVGLLGSGFYNG